MTFCYINHILCFDKFCIIKKDDNSRNVLCDNMITQVVTNFCHNAEHGTVASKISAPKRILCK